MVLKVILKENNNSPFFIVKMLKNIIYSDIIYLANAKGGTSSDKSCSKKWKH